jgi:streptogramin lyase
MATRETLPSGRSWNHGRRVLTIIVGVAVATGLIWLGLVTTTSSKPMKVYSAEASGTGSTGISKSTSSRSPAATGGSGTSTAPKAVSLPTGFGTPTNLVTDPTRPGVWFLASNATFEDILYWDPVDNSLSQYSFATKENPLPYGAAAGLGVDNSGIVWAGIANTLLRLDPSTGAIQRIALPSVATSPAVVGDSPSGLPPLTSTHTVDGLAVSPDGNIGVITSFSNSVIIYNPRTASFSQVTLSETAPPDSVSALPDGTFVLSHLNSTTVDLVSSQGDDTTQDVGATDLACEYGTCVGATGPSELEQFKPSDSGPGVEPADGDASSSSASVRTPLIIGAPSLAMPDGRMLALTKTGFEAVDVRAPSNDALYSLPGYQCSTQGVGNPTGSSLPAVVECQVIAESVAVDSGGNVWFTTNSGASAIYELESGAL